MPAQTASRTRKVKKTTTAKSAARPAAKKTARKASIAQASDPTLPQIIDPGWAWDDKLPLAQAKQIGNMIYVSGQVAFNPDGKLVGKGNIKAQTRQVFRNIKAILAAAGAKMEHIIKINTYITDASKFMDMLEARGDVFGDNPPASTAVVVAGLAFPGLLIEVEAIAVKP
jgi:reactive intermediate/imine deaminase